MLDLSKIKPDFIYRDNKAVAAVLDIDVFNEILEKLEDDDDINYLKNSRPDNFEFIDFDDYLAEKKRV